MLQWFPHINTCSSIFDSAMKFMHCPKISIVWFITKLEHFFFRNSSMCCESDFIFTKYSHYAPCTMLQILCSKHDGAKDKLKKWLKKKTWSWFLLSCVGLVSSPTYSFVSLYLYFRVVCKREILVVGKLTDVLECYYHILCLSCSWWAVWFRWKSYLLVNHAEKEGNYANTVIECSDWCVH